MDVTNSTGCANLSIKICDDKFKSEIPVNMYNRNFCRSDMLTNHRHDMLQTYIVGTCST